MLGLVVSICCFGYVGLDLISFRFGLLVMLWFG